MSESSGHKPASGAIGGGARTGLICGLGAYTLWGVFPLYFRAVAHVTPSVILCHRVVWSAVFMVAVISARGEWRAIREILRSRRRALLLTGAALLIALNWLLFIYAVSSRQVLQASLGYFINPLFSIALGMIFLGERLRGWQWVAVAIAGAGVANLGVRGEGFPWLAVSLAVSFGLYGLVRKKVDVHSLHALLVESVLLVPCAAVYLALVPSPALSTGTLGLLSLSGVITAVPLMLFGAALRQLKLSTMGFLQYVGPTLQFLVAVVLFAEPLDRAKLGSFGLCWLAIAVYVADSILHRGTEPPVEEPD